MAVSVYEARSAANHLTLTLTLTLSLSLTLSLTLNPEPKPKPHLPDVRVARLCELL